MLSLSSPNYYCKLSKKNKKLSGLVWIWDLGWVALCFRLNCPGKFPCKILNRKVRDITKRIACLIFLLLLGKNPRRTVILVSFHLHQNKKEIRSWSFKSLSQIHNGVVHLEIQFWHFLKTEEWSGLDCVFFCPLPHPQNHPLMPTVKAVLSNVAQLVGNEESMTVRPGWSLVVPCEMTDPLQPRPTSSTALHGWI